MMASERVRTLELTLQANIAKRSKIDTDISVLSKIRLDQLTDLVTRKKSGLPQLLKLNGELEALRKAKSEAESKLAGFEKGKKVWGEATTDLGEIASIESIPNTKRLH